MSATRSAPLSREALAAAPWAASLAASFAPRGGAPPPRSAAEVEAEVEAETASLLAQRAASAAAASTASSAIPTFHRPKSAVGALAVELRKVAHRIALQHKERGLLEDDELEALWSCVTGVVARRPPDTPPGGSRALRVMPPPLVPDPESESRVSYEELQTVRREFAELLASAEEERADPRSARAALARADERVSQYFSARTFNRFERDRRGRISGRTFMEFVVRHIALTQSRINLGCHDSDADGWLEAEELEEFVARSVPTMAALRNLPRPFAPRYCEIAVRRFMFFDDPHRRGRARISSLLASDALADFNELHAASEDDPRAAKNWFSLAGARRVRKTFEDLDLDGNGTLSKTEFARITHDPRVQDQCHVQGLTSAFVDRVFEEHSLRGPKAAREARLRDAAPKNGVASKDPFIARQMEKRRKQMASEMDFSAYLDFVLAWGDKKHPSSLAYFFRALDVNKTGALTNLEIWTFLKAVHEAWIADPENYELDILDVRDEIFDMVKPEVPGRITLEDLKRCGCADVVFEILCDHTGFWRYDNRESLPRDDEEEGEEEEEEAEEEDGGENAF